MNDKPQTIEEIRSHTIKHMEREKAQAEKIIQLTNGLASMPEPLPVLYCYGHGYCADAGLKLRAEDRADAVRLFSMFEPLPIAVAKLGTVGAKPVDCLTDAEKERAEIHDEILPAVYRLGWHDEASLRFWTRFGSLDVDVQIIIAKDAGRTAADHERDGNHRIVRHRWRRDGLPNGEAIRYASGSHDTPGEVMVYFWREPGGAAPTLADYLCGNMPA